MQTAKNDDGTGGVDFVVRYEQGGGGRTSRSEQNKPKPPDSFVVFADNDKTGLLIECVVSSQLCMRHDI